MASSAAKVSADENLYDAVNFTSYYSKLRAACARTTHGSVVLGGVRQDPITAFKLYFPNATTIINEADEIPVQVKDDNLDQRKSKAFIENHRKSKTMREIHRK